MNQRNQSFGHLAAFFTVLIWGTTFISTKILLRSFSAAEILFYRFGIGYLTLWALYPRRLRLDRRKQELLFAAAGLCGITLYYLFENIALSYSLASSVSVIVSTAPFFTALLAHFFLDGEPLRANFVCGFFFAITGIVLISWNGSALFHLNPLGDILSVLAAFVWASYVILGRKISAFGYNTIQTTRHTFLWGLLFMLPVLFLSGFHFEPARFGQPLNFANMAYLALGASAICFVTWNLAVRLLGAVKTSVYIYITPVISIIGSALILHERITKVTLLGTLLTLSGLLLSERRMPQKVPAD